MEMIFNELSLDRPLPDSYEARDKIADFVRTMAMARILGVLGPLRTPSNFCALELAPGYSIGAWFVDETVERELKGRLRSEATKAPYLEDMFADFEAANDALAEVRHDGEAGLGLGLAAFRDLPLLSFAAERWQETRLTVETLILTDEEEAVETQDVVNWPGPGAIDRFRGWIDDRQRSEIADGPSLLVQAPDVLPHLDLMPACREQLGALTGNEQPFREVVRHLLALNRRAADWTDGTFEAGCGVPCSDESETVLSNAKLRRARTFLCDDGEAQVFSWHSKINIQAWRVHFLADPASRRVRIGYVGRHLPTANDRT
ncbi:MAG: hypothetical protein HKM95_04040 [Inquilinus sp.]|nr:hypothetical protein [Inquilinus sp.]